MDKEINIAEILKDKPKGVKLYSPLCGDCWLITADYKGDEFGKKFPIIVSRGKDDGINAQKTLSLTVRGFFLEEENSECLLFPSKEMRDWEKFTWEEGDALFNQGTMAMFDGWSEKDYTKFNAKYSVSTEKDGKKHFYEDEIFNTKDFKKAGADKQSDFIKKIEKEYDGKLNLKTLEIEKQPKFKDGDFVYTELKCGFKAVSIFQGLLCQNRIAVYVNFFLDEKEPRLADSYRDYNILCESEGIAEMRLATEEEKELILSKLANIGKKWNTETKQIEDLHKPFDRVLVRMSEKDVWAADLFSHYSDNKNCHKYACVGATWKFCIPYNKQTAHLLGTTDSPKE